MKKPLILVGGGGHCKSVIEAAESSDFLIRGILDLPKYLGQKIFNYEIIGCDDDIYRYVGTCDFVVTLGYIRDPSLRVKLHNRITEMGGTFAKIIASTAHVSKYAQIGDGTVVLHQACINAGAEIGKGCIINTMANIEHDVKVGDYCHISTGAMINGDCIVGDKTFIGSQAVLVNGISVQDYCVIGAGSIVCRNLQQKGTYIGNPASMINIK